MLQIGYIGTRMGNSVAARNTPQPSAVVLGDLLETLVLPSNLVKIECISAGRLFNFDLRAERCDNHTPERSHERADALVLNAGLVLRAAPVIPPS